MAMQPTVVWTKGKRRVSKEDQAWAEKQLKTQTTKNALPTDK
jgi:hypothetical protein